MIAAHECDNTMDLIVATKQFLSGCCTVLFYPVFKPVFIGEFSIHDDLRHCCWKEYQLHALILPYGYVKHPL